MTSAVLSPRLLAHLQLALLGDCGCQHTLSKLDKQARGTGMSGAEIDAALKGGSFEARAAAAVALACAVKAGDADAIARAAQHAGRIGFKAQELNAVSDAARSAMKALQPC